MKEFQSIPLYDDVFKQNPHQTNHRLVSQSPIHRIQFPNGILGWLITGHEAAIQTFSHPGLSKQPALSNPRSHALALVTGEPQPSLMQAHLLNQDPPKHTAMRNLIAPAFAASRIEGFRKSITRHVNRLLDQICDNGQADLIAEFAAKLPMPVLAEVIGLSEAHRDQFKSSWRKATISTGATSTERSAYIAVLVEVNNYVNQLISESRGGNPASLIVRLVAAHDADKLDGDELRAILFQLLTAGQEPVTNQIGNAILALLQNPEQLQNLRKKRSVDATALSELLRYGSAYELTSWRFFSEEGHLFGATIAPTEGVIISLNAANRDPKRFRCPHLLTLERTDNAPLNFGYDHHYCPAASLVKLQVEISVQHVIERLPNLRLATATPKLNFVSPPSSHGLRKLPVMFGPLVRKK